MTVPAHLLTFKEKPISVLDHGFVSLVDVMGDDTAIVEMARTSYQGGTTHTSSDAGLIRYLMRHKHTSPFEGCEIKLCIKMPIFVARQWFRHRTHSANEVSARYSVLPEEFYIPETLRMKTQSQTNKQGSGGSLDPDLATTFRSSMEEHSSLLFKDYADYLEGDLTRELARITLPMNTYTVFYWKQNLHNLFHLLHLREDSHAQFEIQEYARAISVIVKEWVPQAYDAFVNYRRDAVQFSKVEIELMRELLSMSDVQERLFEKARLSLKGRELAEFKQKLNL